MRHIQPVQTSIGIDYANAYLVNNGGSMTMFEVQLFAYGQHFHFIFIQAEDVEDAEEQVNILNSIDSDVSFQLTGNTK